MNPSTIQPIKNVPHYNCKVTSQEKQLAAALRMEFVPKISRRLRGHHLRGFKGGEVLDLVAKYKKEYPYFVRLDISKFYPSIRHRDLVVNTQICYRDLLSLKYVPNSFKTKYLLPLNNWCSDLPLRRGIPLGSPVSSLLSGVMLVPLWLKFKQDFKNPFIVFVDDFLFFAKTPYECSQIYAFIENGLFDNYALQLNLNKCTSGRFSTEKFNFLGWSFRGGYAVIDDAKMEKFKEGFVAELGRSLSEHLTKMGLPSLHY